MAIKIPKFEFEGIKRIEIPKLDSEFNGGDFGLAIIKKYLPQILNTHQQNSTKIDFLYRYFLGQQDILNKERRYKTDAYNNNQIVENHAKRQVEFKVGFLTGEQRDYTHKADSDSDDLIYLDRYFTDCNFFAKDKVLKKWVYATGIGVTHTSPRTDIILDKGVDELTGANIVKYATKEDGFDINYNAPFNFETLDPKDNFVVYSSAFNKEPLFCVSIVDVDVSKKDDKIPQIHKEMLIETRYASFVVHSDKEFVDIFWNDANTYKMTPKTLKYLPMIEHSVNDDRIGLIETNRSLYNSINTFRSAVADMTVDSANAILVFKNVDIDSKEVQAMKKAGAIVISDSQQSRTGSSADLDTITIEIPFDGLNNYIDELVHSCYDIAGVPLASGQVTSGGDTGQARLIGGGWNNAYISINNDITTLKGYDYDNLKLILLLCRQVPNCPLDQLYTSQIDISYRVNQNDNFVNKTQGMMNLYSMNMPLEQILKSSKLFNDIKTVSKEWQARLDELEEKQKESQVATNTPTAQQKETTEVGEQKPNVDNRVESANNDNGSKE